MRPDRPTDGSREAPPYGWAAVATLAVGLLYILTLSRSTAFWDTSEYIATAHIMGIPHPPGNPTFVVLGRFWDLLLAPLGLSTAAKINLFSAAVSASAHGLWFLVVHRMMSHISPDRTFRLIGAFSAVILSATAFTVWNQSNVNEKVYTVSLLTIALISWLAVRWRENIGLGKDDNLLVLMVFILALSVGNHLMAFLVAPALALFVLLVRPATVLNVRLYMAGLVVAVLGLSIHLFLPIRAEQQPIINEGAPVCESTAGALTSILTFGGAGCEELSASLSREQYSKPSVLERPVPFWAQMGNYIQYFDWQWARSVQGRSAGFAWARAGVTSIFVLLGLAGILTLIVADRPAGLYQLVLFGTLSVALVFYLNFKYGFSFPAPPEMAGFREVRERDYFFIVGFSIWGLWSGLGLAALWRWLRKESWLPGWAPHAVLALAFVPLALNWSWASRAHDYSARDWAYNLLMSVEPYAVLVTNGDNDTFPLWYLQEVEGIRRDVTVVVGSYLRTEWYAGQLIGLSRPCELGESAADDPTVIRCQRPYDASNTGAMYVSSGAEAESAGKVPLLVDAPPRMPDAPILDLGPPEIAQLVRSYVPASPGRIYDLGGVITRVPDSVDLYPEHRLLQFIIHSSIGRRPIYFAATGYLPYELGLSPYLLRQGLAYRVLPEPVRDLAPEGVAELAPSENTAFIGQWVDVPRTERLAWEVFQHRGGFPEEWPHWPDRASSGIPAYYGWMHEALAQAALTAGDQDAASRNFNRSEAFQRLR